MRYDKSLLYIRELNENEAEQINSAKVITPMQMCPDEAVIIETGEIVMVIHAYKSNDGLNYCFNNSEGKYSHKNESEIKLLNPKFNWNYVADLDG